MGCMKIYCTASSFNLTSSNYFLTFCSKTGKWGIITGIIIVILLLITKILYKMLEANRKKKRLLFIDVYINQITSNKQYLNFKKHVIKRFLKVYSTLISIKFWNSWEQSKWEKNITILEFIRENILLDNKIIK